MRMKIFILEDNQQRIEWFQDFFDQISDDVKYVTTAEDGKQMVTSEKFDVIFLDHDLGGQVYVDSQNDNTGYQVALKMINGQQECPVVVHSLNSIGANNIVEYLNTNAYKNNVVRAPFGSPGFFKICEEVKAQCVHTA